MSRTAVALLGAVALLSTGLPAHAAAPVDPLVATPVSAVKLEWVDVAQGQIRISWSESAPVANTVYLNTGTFAEVGTTTAAGPNELLVTARGLGYSISSADKVTIVVTDPDGGGAVSPAFDRYLPYPNGVSMYTNEGGNAVHWAVPHEDFDPTPDDPLDVVGGNKFEVKLLEGRPIECDTTDWSDDGTTSGIIPERSKPYTIVVRAHNEWLDPTYASAYGNVVSSTLLVTSPTVTQYGAVTTISGSLTEKALLVTTTPPHCVQYDEPGAGRQVVLQARNTSTSPWYVVGSRYAIEQGRFVFTVKSPGAREYRVVRAMTSSGGTIVLGAWTAAKLVRSTTRVVSAKFIAPTITYGTKPQAYLWVDPAGSQKAALQFKNASGVWQGLTYKTLYAGRGLVAFTFNRRGATQFRWWVPGSTTGTGLKVDPVYSGVFTLTVR
jgi:hypothetical protein